MAVPPRSFSLPTTPRFPAHRVVPSFASILPLQVPARASTPLPARRRSPRSVLIRALFSQKRVMRRQGGGRKREGRRARGRKARERARSARKRGRDAPERNPPGSNHRCEERAKWLFTSILSPISEPRRCQSSRFRALPRLNYATCMIYMYAGGGTASRETMRSRCDRTDDLRMIHHRGDYTIGDYRRCTSVAVAFRVDLYLFNSILIGFRTDSLSISMLIEIMHYEI